MKKILSAVIVITFLGCDKVNQPIQNEQVIVSNRKVLLEDYTGHKCGNCPAAAEVAEKLDAKYYGNVIVVAVHAGFFAKTNASYPTSYTTTAGNDWDAASTGFGISSAGNPNGMINRYDFGSGRILKETSWEATVAQALQKPDICDMWITLDYKKQTGLLTADVKTKFKKTYGNSTMLSVVLLEDSIIGPQTDYRLTPDRDTNYVFMHMLRGSLNGSWGSNLKSPPIKYDDSVTLSYKNYQIDTLKFKAKHLSVVAFVYDAVTKEVIEVEKAKFPK